ncbi:MAG TPA: 4'-phosphopantetheinyl transferase superfamily protein [Opitutaceae bacterium]|jgi:4'-phosphopantetheinyl transferase
MQCEFGWTLSGPLRAPPPGECQVWRVRADLPREAWQPFLSGEEWAGLNRFHFEADARREAASRGARRRLLAAGLGRPHLELQFSLGEHGKPGLRGEPRLEFSASHSGSWALLAVSAAGRVGVDVEQHRRLEMADVAERYFHPDEVREWRALPETRKTEGFFRLWTLKESYVKALGRGLSKSLQSYRVGSGADVALLSCDDDAEAAGRWALAALPMETGYAAALAAEEPLNRCRTFTLR